MWKSQLCSWSVVMKQQNNYKLVNLKLSLEPVSENSLQSKFKVYYNFDYRGCFYSLQSTIILILGAMNNIFHTKQLLTRDAEQSP